MKERRFRRWRKERQFYKDNYTVQEGKLVNTGQRWIHLDKVEDRMYTVYRKRLEWEVGKMRKETERTQVRRDKEFEDVYLKEKLDEKSFIEGEVVCKETDPHEKENEGGLLRQEPN